MSISTFNRRWAAVLLETLSRHGVSHVCIAPGSRSTPLTLEAAGHKRFICHTHFDERGLGHLALGLAKASREPVAVIVTSGTAVANLYPALIEASLTGERLVLITADRPAELIDCGANQAIRQQGIFSSYPAATLNLPRPSPDISAAWLASAVDSAMADAECGSLHINCPFSEPLYGGDPNEYQAWSQQLGTWWQSEDRWLNQTSMRENVMQPDWPLWRLKRGVIIAGRLTAQEGESVAEWAANLGWPLLSDILSSTGQPLPHADLWLNHPQAQSILAKSELVIQFGSSLTGKRMLQWQAGSTPTEYWLIDSLNGRLDPANHRGRRIVADIRQWLALHPTAGQHNWAESLYGLVEQTQNYVQARLVETFTEASIARRLPELLPNDGQLFVGNSLIVRLIDALAQLPRGYPVYSNRGASGIDGLISTSAGVLRATNKPTLAIIGDISALYDLNSLSLFSQRQNAPMVLIVINNNGGSIFPATNAEQERERFYRMPHGFNFKHAAAMFGLKYICPESRQELNAAVDNIWSDGGMLLVEINVPEHQGAQTLREMVQRAGEL